MPGLRLTILALTWLCNPVFSMHHFHLSPTEGPSIFGHDSQTSLLTHCVPPPSTTTTDENVYLGGSEVQGQVADKYKLLLEFKKLVEEKIGDEGPLVEPTSMTTKPINGRLATSSSSSSSEEETFFENGDQKEAQFSDYLTESSCRNWHQLAKPEGAPLRGYSHKEGGPPVDNCEIF